MPIALPIFSRGTIAYSMDMQTTGRIPPGIACRIRKKIKLFRFQANPHSADAPAKATRHTR
jgi:hypothetical protein